MDPKIPFNHDNAFLQWINLKERLHQKKDKPPYINEGEIWWASLGKNIGYEINGKSRLFTRPTIIFKKLSRGFYFVIPATTKKKEGSWYVQYKQNKKTLSACLHQARAIDSRRLFSKLGELNVEDFERIEEKFKKLYT